MPKEESTSDKFGLIFLTETTPMDNGSTGHQVVHITYVQPTSSVLVRRLLFGANYLEIPWNIRAQNPPQSGIASCCCAAWADEFPFLDGSTLQSRITKIGASRNEKFSRFKSRAQAARVSTILS
jgi:hypothetical protein